MESPKALSLSADIEMKSWLTGYEHPRIKFLFELRELSGA